MRLGACATLLPALGESDEQIDVLRDVWTSESQGKGSARVEAVPESEPISRRMGAAWSSLWQAFVDDLVESQLVNDEESAALKACESVGTFKLQLRSAEASRRLDFFLKSLADPSMPASTGALVAPGCTVLVPSYNEMVLLQLPDEASERDCRDASEALRDAMRDAQRVGHVEMLEAAILVARGNGFVDAALVEEAE
eukprot:2355427-Prymnesium_polylepis.1